MTFAPLAAAASATPARKPRTDGALNDTTRETLALFRAGNSIDEIAAERGLATATIEAHLLAAIESGEELPRSRFMSDEVSREIESAFAAESRNAVSSGTK